MKTPLFNPLYVDVSELPWHPFTPYSNEVQLKIIYCDQAIGRTVLMLKAPGGGSLGVHYHFGPVWAYTIKGKWYYEEHKKDWIATGGSYLMEVANSSHTFHAVEDAEIFIIADGALSFLDADGNEIGRETSKTFQDRYMKYCEDHDIPVRDINTVPAAN